MKTTFFLAAIALTVFACGDDKKKPDAPTSIDAPPIDAPGMPAAPHIGAQFDRMGRPAINTALNNVVTPGVCMGTTTKCFHDSDCGGTVGSCMFTTKNNAKDAYNADSSQGTWITNNIYIPQFAVNAAIFDSLDKGYGTATSLTFHCGTGIGATTCTKESDCTGGTHCVSDACGNQVGYNGVAAGGGAPMQCFNAGVFQATCSYATIGTLVADDQLYVDTTMTTCGLYLAVELNYILGGAMGAGINFCGGRSPTDDVIDATYSAVSAGLNAGFDPATFAPKIGDGVGPHKRCSNKNSATMSYDVCAKDTDCGTGNTCVSEYSDTFPFFGAPH